MDNPFAVQAVLDQILKGKYCGKNKPNVMKMKGGYMNSCIKNVPVLIIVLVVLWPLSLILPKRYKRKVLQRIISVLQWLRLIDIGKLNYAQLESFGIDDVCENKILWSRKDKCYLADAIFDRGKTT
jgi:hypothetical protein